MVKHHICKVKKKKGNNGGSKPKQKQKLVKKAKDDGCAVSSSSAGSTDSVETILARSSTHSARSKCSSAGGREDNATKEVVLCVPAAATPNDKELAHAIVPDAAGPKDGEVFVEGFLPVKLVKPEDGFSPVKAEFFAAVAGLLPGTAYRLAMDVILPLPDIPLIRRYISWHPPVEGFYFQLKPVEVWQTETGANANILFNSFRLTGMPPLLWKTMCAILPPLEIDED